MLDPFDYARPESVIEACRLLESAGRDGQAIAGGTELLPALKNRQKKVRLLVDLGGIPGLDQIHFPPGEGLRVGSQVTLRRLAAHPVVKEKYPGLHQAALSAGSPQLQAMATMGGNLCQDTCCLYFNRSAAARSSREPCHKLGGNVCHVVHGSADCWAGYAGDMAPALLALRARIKVAGPGGEQCMPLREFFTAHGLRPNRLASGQIVTEIQAPPPRPYSGAAYSKLRQRGTLDYPLLGVAVHLALEPRSAVCREAGLALTAVDEAPVVVEEAAKLEGQEITTGKISELAEAARHKAHPLKNVGGLPASYRREMVSVYVESAVRQAVAAASGG